ncbi:TonB-dependent receptor [uncultured Draconibacterium sp.]|uniref:TonB-dependent receptor n=1 Tax=uncultured Draconibacterium sp. TaxID=1573823 RepID=UPI003216CE3A
MTIKRSLAFLFLFFSLFSFAQERVTLSGLVKDKTTGEPLIGANIILLGSNNGISSDSYGFYSLEAKKTSTLLKASFIGYKPFEEEIDLKTSLHFDILLEPGIELEEVQVSALKKIEDRLELGAVEIPVKQIKNMPMFGEPDVLKTMQLLPGVQAGSEGRSGLYVRGGSPDQNLFMLDGTSLYYVNHLGGFVSVFHPDILKNVKLYKGGYPARFGGRLSSVVDLRMKEGNKKELHGSYGIGLISGDITLEGPIKTDKTSFIVSARRVWLDILSRPITRVAFQGATLGYNFYDVYGKISHEVDAFNRLYISFYGGDDKLGTSFKDTEDDINSKTKYIWGNIQSTLRWNRVYTPKVNSDVTLFYTRYRYSNNISYSTGAAEGYNKYFTGVHDLGLKADYNWYVSENYKQRFGAGFSKNWFKPGQINVENTDDNIKTDTLIGTQNQIQALNAYIYSEHEIVPFKWWNFNAGVRLANYRTESKHYFSIEPRFLSVFNLNKLGALKLAYTKMVQPVHMLTYSGSTFPIDIWLPSTPEIPPGIATQYSIGYSKTFAEGTYELSLEVYDKQMKQLVEVKGGVPLVSTNSWEQNVEQNGIGNSRGIEFLLRKSTGKNTGWISYTLSKSDREFENINNGKPYPFNYDRRHDISIVFNRKLKENIDFSATWIYGTGYPTTLHNGVYLAVENINHTVDSPSDPIFQTSGEAYLYPGKNWLRMSAYHRLDLGFNFRKNINKKGKTSERTWTVGVYNAYNRQNAVAYYYEHRNQDSDNPIVLYQQSGFPFIPTIKYSVKF